MNDTTSAVWICPYCKKRGRLEDEAEELERVYRENQASKLNAALDTYNRADLGDDDAD